MLPGAKTWVEISRETLAANISALRSILQPDVALCAVVKANAYGHDLRVVTRIAAENGVACFGVDNIDEAIIVRGIASQATVFILGYTVPERLRDAVYHGFVQTVYDEETVMELAKVAAETQRVARVSLKVETGLHRQGVGPRGIDPVLDAVARYPELVVLDGVSSHFASAEDPGDPLNAHQMHAFSAAVDRIRGRGFDPAHIHIACSAAALLAPGAHWSMVRTGISLYGLWPSMETRRAVVLGRNPIDLQPVLSWRTRIAQVKDVPSGQRIGYNGTYLTNRPMRIAVVPVGYSDGYDRGLSNKGEMLVRGRKCPVVGRVCMNITMIDVSAVPNVKAGDPVTLLGRDGMHVLTADDMAITLGTINYEVVTRINWSIPRIVT